MLTRAYDNLIMALALLAGVMIASVFFFIVFDVTLRTTGFRPPEFVSAVSEYVLLYVTMLAAPWLVRERGHVRIGSFLSFAPPHFQRLADQIQARYHTEVELEDGLVEAIRSRATRSENGARMLESIIEGELLPPVSLALLEKLAAREPVTKVTLGVEENRFTGTVA